MSIPNELPASNSQLPKAVLFDIDGTLIDSNAAHAHAWVAAFAEHDVHVEFDKVRRCIGMGGDKLMPAVSGIEEESPLGQRISERRGEIFKSEHLPRLRPFPGTRELVERVKALGIAVVAASSAKKDELAALLETAGVKDRFDAATSGDEADASKPHPDIVHAALEKASAHPDEAILIGDTPYDVEAARRACVGAIAFRCGGWSDADLRRTLAIYDGPGDLLARFEESPLTHVRAKL